MKITIDLIWQALRESLRSEPAEGIRIHRKNSDGTDHYYVDEYGHICLYSSGPGWSEKTKSLGAFSYYDQWRPIASRIYAERKRIFSINGDRLDD